MLALVGWAVLTVPLSYWPGGSVTRADRSLPEGSRLLLADRHGHHDPAAVARCSCGCWCSCSMPLSVTALQNYASGDFLQTPTAAAAAHRRLQRGGSGLAANPNDLALMLNLMIPFAGALWR